MTTPEWLIVEDDEVVFKLNAAILNQIQQDIERNPHNFYDLDDRTLIKFAVGALGITPKSQGALVFNSYYTDEVVSEQETILVLRTVVSIDGDVIFTVRESFLENAIATKVANVHNYLSKRVMVQFQTAIADYIQTLLKPWLITGFLATSIICLQPLGDLLMQYVDNTQEQVDSIEIATKVIPSTLPAIALSQRQKIFNFISQKLLGLASSHNSFLRKAALSTLRKFFKI